MTDSILIFLAIYFAPSGIAFHRKHPQLKAIFAANVFFGFTFIGWAWCFVWSLTTEREQLS
jgi:hypothetical protein